MEREKGEMKQRLWNWGNALERFHWKEGELGKLQEMYELQADAWEESGTEREEKLRLEREYTEKRGSLRMEMVEILREKGRIDGLIGRLDIEEQEFLQLRFGKGYGFAYIGMRMHLSRATLFRMQDRILEKLCLFQKETG